MSMANQKSERIDYVRVEESIGKQAREIYLSTDVVGFFLSNS